MMTEKLKDGISFLKGGGEMGHLISEKDWSKNTLGDPESWPQSLRTALSIVIHSKFPMFLFWGPDLICFYNDAYRPSLGQNGKHPDILGTSGKDAWPEIWDVIKPLIDTVLAGGEATWSEDQLIPIYRNGKIEDVYWTFSYSPVNDESGNPAGIFVTCAETTDKVINIRKLKESTEQLKFAIDATELATWDLNPLTNKFIADDRYTEWFGVPAANETDNDLALNVIADEDRERVIEAYTAALIYGSGKKYDIEYTIRPQNKPERILRAKGTAWFNEEKICYRFNGTLQDVTQQVFAKKALEESEKNLRLMIQQAPVAMCIFRGPDFIVEIANERMFELWGKSSEQVLNKPIFTGLPEAKNQGFEELLHNVYTTGKTFTAYGLPIILPRNETLVTVFINFVYEAYREADDRISGIMAVASEVTEQVLANKKIEESEKEFRELADSLPQLVWTTDNKGKQTFSSNRWIEFSGLDPHVEGFFKNLAHPDDFDNIMSIWRNSLAENIIYKTEVRLKSKTGEYHWFYVNGEPIKNEKGEVEKWVGAFTNINEQKIAEEKSRLTSDRFRLLADSMPQFVWTGDANGNLNYYNKAVYDYSGLSVEQIANDGWLQIVHPDEREENVRQWIEAITTGNDFVFAHRFRRYDGEYRWQLSRAVPQKDSEGNIELWVGTSTDIQEIKELDQQKDSFISIASHELKTPVTTIKAYGQIAEAMLEKKGDTATLGMIKKMGTQVNRLTTLIEDLLNVTKIQKGKLLYNESIFDFNSLVKESIDDMQRTSNTHTIKNNSGSSANIYGDKDKLNQVLNNLISNAIKYSPDANEIIVATELKEDGVQLSVQDFGIGISAQEQQHIFEQFYRVNGVNQSTFPGMGIGLYICSGIITRHSGKIWVESAADKGSVFYIMLPFDHRKSELVNSQKVLPVKII